MAAQLLNQTNLHSVSKIGIIGAGISGIAAAKQLSGHSPVVFEATDSIGGVWKHCSYASTKLQTPRCAFEFSDYPWSERVNANFLSHVEVLDYLHGYATHFDLLKFVKFGSRVVEIRYVGGDSTSTGTETSESLKSGEYGTLLAGHPVWEVGVQISNHPDSTIEVCYSEIAPIVSFFIFMHAIVFHAKLCITDRCYIQRTLSAPY